MMASMSGRPWTRRPHDRHLAAADADPGAKRSRRRLREHPLVLQRCAGLPPPRHRPLPEQLHEQVELLLEELLVLRQVIAEEGERLGERPAAEDDLGPSVGDGVEGREPLEDPHRVVRAEDGHRRPQVDPLGLAGDGCQHDLRRRDREVLAVVLADAEEVEPEAVGQDRFLDDVAEDLGMRQRLSVAPERDVAERVEPELEGGITHR